jgi:hypothetical protein
LKLLCGLLSLNCPKPGYTRITCSTILNIHYNLIFATKFNHSSILITIISCDYLNLSLADEHVGDVTMPTQVIKYSNKFLQGDCTIQIKLNYNEIKTYGILYFTNTFVYLYIMSYLYHHLHMHDRILKA